MFQDVLGLVLDEEFIITRLTDTFIHIKVGSKNFGFNFFDEFSALEFYATSENCLEILRMNNKGTQKNCLNMPQDPDPEDLPPEYEGF